jgi:hypothetical protein
MNASRLRSGIFIKGYLKKIKDELLQPHDLKYLKRQSAKSSVFFMKQKKRGKEMTSSKRIYKTAVFLNQDPA